MNARLPRIFALTAVLLGWLSGCAEDVESRRVKVPVMDPEAISRDALAIYDADHDGAIAGEELDRCPGLKQGLRQIDADGDRRVTAEELAARIRQYQDDNLGIIGFIGHVMLDGEPLVGAEITLVPERFMGTSIEPARAITDPGGDFRVKTKGLDPKLIGARAGIYRIRISKKDASGNETIPAEYNAQTSLGVELGDGSPVTTRGLELELISGNDSLEDGGSGNDSSENGG